MKHYGSNKINYKMGENLSTRKCHQWLDARKFSCAKISMFTVSARHPDLMAFTLVYDMKYINNSSPL